MLNEDDIDFRILGLPHSVVKQADNYRVRELVKQMENHPHREALQHDLQQNNTYNAFGDKSKKMIMDMGYAELFELFETDPKTQCKECLLYWSESIVYCTCEHLLKESAANRGVNQKNWTFSQFQTTWLRKGDPMATDVGKLHKRKNIIKPIIRKRDASRKVLKRSTIAFRWIPNFVHPSSNMIEMKKSVSKWMILRTKIFSHCMTESEYFRYRQIWWNSLNNSGNTGPLRNRSDFNEALSTNRPHQESGERQLKPIPFWKYRPWHQSSSSSSGWLHWSDSWWNSW